MESPRLHRGHRAVFVSSLRPCRATREPAGGAPPSRRGRATVERSVPALPRAGEGALALCDWVSNSPGSPCATRGESERPPRYGRAVGTRRLVLDTYRQIVDTVEQCRGTPGTRTSGDDALLAGRGAMGLPSNLPRAGTFDSSRRRPAISRLSAKPPGESVPRGSRRLGLARAPRGNCTDRRSAGRILGTDQQDRGMVDEECTCRSAPLPISSLPSPPVCRVHRRRRRIFEPPRRWLVALPCFHPIVDAGSTAPEDPRSRTDRRPGPPGTLMTRTPLAPCWSRAAPSLQTYSSRAASFAVGHTARMPIAFNTSSAPIQHAC
jgi:hypothetical protein